VVAGADGVAVFDALHRRGRVSDAIAADGRADEMEAVLLRSKEKMTSRNACQGYEPWAAGGDFQGRSSFGRLGVYWRPYTVP
jgi:hypothetical protein